MTVVLLLQQNVRFREKKTVCQIDLKIIGPLANQRIRYMKQMSGHCFMTHPSVRTGCGRNPEQLDLNPTEFSFEVDEKTPQNNGRCILYTKASIN